MCTETGGVRRPCTFSQAREATRRCDESSRRRAASIAGPSGAFRAFRRCGPRPGGWHHPRGAARCGFGTDGRARTPDVACFGPMARIPRHWAPSRYVSARIHAIRPNYATPGPASVPSGQIPQRSVTQVAEGHVRYLSARPQHSEPRQASLATAHATAPRAATGRKLSEASPVAGVLADLPSPPAALELLSPPFPGCPLMR